MKKVAIFVAFLVCIVMGSMAATSSTANIKLTGYVEYNFSVYNEWVVTTPLDLSRTEPSVKTDVVGFSTNYNGTWKVDMYSVNGGALLRSGGGDSIIYQLQFGSASWVQLNNTAQTMFSMYGPKSNHLVDLFVRYTLAGPHLEGTYTDTIVVTMYGV